MDYRWVGRGRGIERRTGGEGIPGQLQREYDETGTEYGTSLTAAPSP